MSDVTVTLHSKRVTGSGVLISPQFVKAIMFTCETGGEIINGVPRLAGQVIVLEHFDNGINKIPYDAATGAIQIDYLA